MATYSAGIRNDGGKSRITNEGDAGLPSVDLAGRLGVSDLGKPLGVDPNKGQRDPVPVALVDELLQGILLDLVRGAACAVPNGSQAPTYKAGLLVRPLTTGSGILYVLAGHPETETIEFAFTTAQTNAVLVQGVAGQRIVVTRLNALLDKDSTANIAVRAGFSATGSLTATSSSGVRGVVSTHPDIAPGSGMIEGGYIVGAGKDGESLLFTCDTPTAGLRVLVAYHMER